jgi:probable phosphoglycerate mutase
MQATRIIAIRHGETDWNAGARIQGHTDIALNARGRWQAERLAHALAHESFDAVYASDLARALQTARPFAQRSGLSPQPEPGLRERAFGDFEGLAFAEIEQRWPDAARRWRARDASFGAAGGGERLDDFYARCVACASALGARHLGQTIALVAHGGVLDCLYRAAARIPLDAPRTWQLANAGINRLLYTPEGLTLVGWGDTAHLELDSIEAP